MNTEEAAPVKMVVDEDKCIGAGQCELLEEDTFYVDDDTVIAQVIGTGMLPEDRAKKVVEACPSQAISVLGRDSRPTSLDASAREEVSGEDKAGQAP